MRAAFYIDTGHPIEAHPIEPPGERIRRCLVLLVLALSAVVLLGCPATEEVTKPKHEPSEKPQWSEPEITVQRSGTKDDILREARSYLSPQRMDPTGIIRLGDRHIDSAKIGYFRKIEEDMGGCNDYTAATTDRAQLDRLLQDLTSSGCITWVIGESFPEAEKPCGVIRVDVWRPSPREYRLRVFQKRNEEFRCATFYY